VAYDEALAERIREATAGQPGLSERKMFGGLALMVGGNMFCGVVGDSLMARVGTDRHHEALMRPHVRPMDFTGRPMRSMVFVGPEGVREPADLAAWVSETLAFALSLPPKR
jgi:TfoX/Sxy family transcriptional regulator of competence genes